MKDYDDFLAISNDQEWMHEVLEAIDSQIEDPVRKYKQLFVLSKRVFPYLEKRLSQKDQILVHERFISVYQSTGHKIEENKALLVIINDWKSSNTERCRVDDSVTVENLAEAVREDLAAAAMIRKIATNKFVVVVDELLEIAKKYPKAFVRSAEWGMDIKPKTLEALSDLLLIGDGDVFKFWSMAMNSAFVEKHIFANFWRDFHKKISNRPGFQKLSQRIKEEYLDFKPVLR